ncbi:hypothetical protein ACOSQ2_026765 [Xanthoceras sorbifolium]
MTMSEYILKMKGLADPLTATGQLTTDQDVIMNVLHGLGLEYDSVIVHITSRQNGKNKIVLHMNLSSQVKSEVFNVVKIFKPMPN